MRGAACDDLGWLPCMDFPVRVRVPCEIDSGSTIWDGTDGSADFRVRWRKFCCLSLYRTLSRLGYLFSHRFNGHILLFYLFFGLFFVPDQFFVICC